MKAVLNDIPGYRDARCQRCRERCCITASLAARRIGLLCSEPILVRPGGSGLFEPTNRASTLEADVQKQTVHLKQLWHLLDHALFVDSVKPVFLEVKRLKTTIGAAPRSLPAPC